MDASIPLPEKNERKGRFGSRRKRGEVEQVTEEEKGGVEEDEEVEGEEEEEENYNKKNVI